MSFVSNIPFLRSGTLSRIGAALRGDAADADGDGAAAASTTEEEAEAGMGRTREGLLTDLKTVASQRPPARIQAPRYLFIASLVALLAIGLVMIYSASSIEGLYYFNNPAHRLIVERLRAAGLQMQAVRLPSSLTERWTYQEAVF